MHSQRLYTTFLTLFVFLQTSICSHTLSSQEYTYSENETSNNFYDEQCNPCEYENECEYAEERCFEPCEEGKLFLKVDFLCFRAFENNLNTCGNFENTTFEDAEGRVFSISREKSKEPNVQWNPGFRIGIGWEFDPSSWDAGVYWTHLIASASNRSNANNLHWKLDFNTVDLLIGNSMFLSPCFSIRPYGGLRLASIDQKVSFHYVSAIDSFGQRLLYDSRRKNKQDFLAGGIHLGIEGDYRFGCGFSVFANAAFSTLYGQSYVKCQEFDDFGSNFDSFVDRKTRYPCLPVSNVAIGIRWLKASESIWFLQQLAWENQRYFDYNQIGDGSDLSLDGLSYSIIIEF